MYSSYKEKNKKNETFNNEREAENGSVFIIEYCLYHA